MRHCLPGVYHRQYVSSNVWNRQFHLLHASQIQKAAELTGKGKPRAVLDGRGRTHDHRRAENRPSSEQDRWRDRDLSEDNRLYWIDDNRQAVDSVAEILRVASFYDQFQLEPVGRHVVEICSGTSCHASRSGRRRRTASAGEMQRAKNGRPNPHKRRPDPQWLR